MKWKDCPRLERVDVEFVDVEGQPTAQFSTWPPIYMLHPNDLRNAAKAMTKFAEAKESGEIAHFGRLP